MDNLDKRTVEMIIECKCIGLDEALEKVTKLVELLKQANVEMDGLKQCVTIDPETLALTATKLDTVLNEDKTPAALEQEFMQTHSGHKSTVYYGPDSEPDATH